jgi:hypothetical protein
MLQDAIPAMQLQRRQQQQQQAVPDPYRVANAVNADRDTVEFIDSWLIVAALVTFIAVLVVG